MASALGPNSEESVGKAEGKLLRTCGRGWGVAAGVASVSWARGAAGRRPAHTGCGALWAPPASWPLLYIKSSPVKLYTEKSECPISVFKLKFGL